MILTITHQALRREKPGYILLEKVNLLFMKKVV